MSHAYFDRGSQAFAALAPVVWDPIGAHAARCAQVSSGDVVWDACCGIGSSALPLAQAVGPAGRVDAVDLAPAMIDLARQRANDRHLHNLEFHVADVTCWAPPPAGYDALVCVLGIFFLPTPITDTAAIIRKVRAGGRVALTVWAEGAVQPLGRNLWDACADVLPEQFATMPAHGPATPFDTADKLLELAPVWRLANAHVAQDNRSLTLNGDDAWNLITGTAFAGFFTEMTTDQVARVRDRFLAAHDFGGRDVDFTTLTLLGDREPG